MNETPETKQPDKPKPKPTPPKRVAPHVMMKLDTIPVDFIKAKPGADFDVPGKIGSSITTDQSRQRNRAHHVVEFVPAWGAFCVYLYMPDGDLPKFVYVPDSMVRSWAALSELAVMP